LQFEEQNELPENKLDYLGILESCSVDKHILEYED